MNVIGTRSDGWWKDRQGAIVQLVDKLERWASTKGDDVAVVFEGPLLPRIRSSVIVIAYAPKAFPNSADDEIVRLVQADLEPKGIRVVTSDRALIDRIQKAGASAYPATRFRKRIDSLG
ncbi:RNA-binding protein [Mycobacterium uberis]|uniref:RNA-binding protein n=2 Tax=Mycobacterium uberis TaxID=2162698 RepID=A0A3E1HGG3_9MYCO|nr:RNA-binding protein [Mycobacterium uberis]